ncbi:DNA primase small subunit PriS [Trichinella pseudospiralis]
MGWELNAEDLLNVKVMWALNEGFYVIKFNLRTCYSINREYHMDISEENCSKYSLVQRKKILEKLEAVPMQSTL